MGCGDYSPSEKLKSLLAASDLRLTNQVPASDSETGTNKGAEAGGSFFIQLSEVATSRAEDPAVVPGNSSA